MTLEEKGKFAPPPKMTPYPQMVSSAIQQWENVIAATHWDLYDRTKVDGSDFYVGKNELGHIHLDGQGFLIKNLLPKFGHLTPTIGHQGTTVILFDDEFALPSC